MTTTTKPGHATRLSKTTLVAINLACSCKGSVKKTKLIVQQRTITQPETSNHHNESGSDAREEC